MTYDYRIATASDLHSLVQKYMSMLGLKVAPVLKVKNNLGAKNLGTCAWKPTQSTTTISIQKSVMEDPATLERIIAHEMAHHAVFLGYIEDLQRIAVERGAGAGPYVRGYVQSVRRADDHGENWQRYVKIINGHQGSGFVTQTSDETYTHESKTKPYWVLIGALPNGRFGFQIGVNLSPKMKQSISRSEMALGAKLIATTDPRWQHGPRIGGLNWATSADKQDEMRRLHAG